MYRPQRAFNVAFKILEPEYQKILGKNVATYKETDKIINCSYTTFGGTEVEVNGMFAVKDTANIETWYNPDIKSDTRLKRMEDGAVFEIIGEPEDIEFRHQFFKFKVERLKGSTNG